MKHTLDHKRAKATCDIELVGTTVTCTTTVNGTVTKKEEQKHDSAIEALGCYFHEISQRSSESYHDWVATSEKSFINASMQDLRRMLQSCDKHDIAPGIAMLTTAMLTREPDCLEAVHHQYLAGLRAINQRVRKDFSSLAPLESRLLELTRESPDDPADTATAKREVRIALCRNLACRIVDQCRIAEYPVALEHFAFLQAAAPAKDIDAYARLAEQELALHASLIAKPLADPNAAFYQALLDNDVVRAKVLTAMGAKLDPAPVVSNLVAKLKTRIASIHAGDAGPDILARAKTIAALSDDVVTASGPMNFEGFENGAIRMVHGSKAYYTFRPASSLVEEETAKAETLAIQQAVTPQLSSENDKLLCDYFVKKQSSMFRFLPLIGSQRAFDLTLAEARKQCTEEYAEDTSSVIALAHFAAIPAFSRPVRAFLTTEAFKTLKAGKNPTSDDLVNQSIFAGVCEAIVLLGDAQLATLLYEQFKFAADKDQHYEMNQICGSIAIGLALLGYHGRRDALKAFMKHFGESYSDSAFVAEVGYALAILSRDATAALKVLADTDDERDRSLAAAAVADLDEKQALPDLDRLLQQVGPGAQHEALREARSRLRKQRGMPALQDRMIRMFGIMTSSQVATSGETDNQFVLRAAQRTSSAPDLPTETDAD